MTLGDIIGTILKKKRITQLELAAQIGKSPTAVSQIINGTYHPSPDTLEKICEVIEIPPAILHFLTVSEEDVPLEKRELYRLLAPSLKNIIAQIFGAETASMFKEPKQV
ncbi:helix-turn-helix domain-containing protein [Aegicerativicinus sediminis]|uniref:helix-turn-helix domain-containing protein n=1 Tax=Aegicerativicinus sediminis TaxID=2893202 RepID=UPI001E52B413|nr:helix-turn-helix transcriptional regulator [Aegicerativicinus sediminis]